MSQYEDYIPAGVHLVQPNYAEMSVTIGDGVTAPLQTHIRNFLQPFAVQSYAGTYAEARFRVGDDVVDSAAEYDDAVDYDQYARVKVSDYGAVYVAGADVPAGNHPLDPESADESGVPYWVEADTIEELKPFDAAAHTELTITDRGLKMTAEVRPRSYAWTNPASGGSAIDITPEFSFDQVSVMGVRYSGIAKKASLRVEVYWTALMNAIENFSEDVNICNYYNAAVISSFSIDMSYRDRASFRMPSAEEAGERPENPTLTGADTFVADLSDDSISVRMYLEPTFTYFPPEIYNTPCGTSYGNPAAGTAHVGLVTVGKRVSIGRTLVGMDLGREVTRTTEANFLNRRTIKSAVETISISALVETADDHMLADYFFRIASETSNIIHAGVPEYDNRFAFGVLDSASPVGSTHGNTITIDGRGVAFAATDPLVTKPQSEGWL